MSVVLSRPFPKQELFLKATTRYVGYGGARGGGKSHALRTKAILMALRYPGIKLLIVRRTYPELVSNHINIMVPIVKNVARYRDKDKVLTFQNGSVIKFGYCANAADALQYQGQEHDVLFIDEATHFTEDLFTKLNAVVRGVNDFPKRTYITCNPGGVGHTWVKERFVDVTNDQCTFIRATVYDNKPLMEKDPEYLKTLEDLPTGLREAWLEGNWDFFIGQYFSSFDPAVHVVDPIPIPDHWRVYRVLDYGLDMLAVLWIAIDTYGQAWVIRELHVPDLIVSDAAKLIVENTYEDIYETIAPPDLWARTKDSGKSVSEIFSENGIIFFKADSSRVNGWMATQEWLKLNNGEPKLRIFNTCHNLITNLPLLQRDEKNPSDAATEPHSITHITDALRYFCITRPVLSKDADTRTDKQKTMEDIKRRFISGRRPSRRRSRY